MSACAPGRGLRPQIGGHGIRELVEQALGGFRVRIQEGARGAELLRGPAAHEITQQREGPAGKADERHAARQRWRASA